MKKTSFHDKLKQSLPTNEQWTIKVSQEDLEQREKTECEGSRSLNSSTKSTLETKKNKYPTK